MIAPSSSSPATLQEQIAALGQWFHNLHLLGLEDRVTFRRMQVYDLAGVEETFDLVLFMGVFYHLRYPNLALDIVAQRVGRMMVFQTLAMPGREVYTNTDGHDFDSRAAMLEPGWPKMAFIEHNFADDPTNWWAPNHACVEAMLRAGGLKVTAALPHELYLCAPDPEHLSSVTTWNTEELFSAIGVKRRGQDNPPHVGVRATRENGVKRRKRMAPGGAGKIHDHRPQILERTQQRLALGLDAGPRVARFQRNDAAGDAARARAGA